MNWQQQRRCNSLRAVFRSCSVCEANGRIQNAALHSAMRADLHLASQWTGRHGALRAGSAGEQPATAYGTCLLVLQNRARAKTPQHPLPETPANRGLPRVEPRSPSSTCLKSIRAKATRETAPLSRKSFLHRAPSAGAGKNALFPSRGIFARGFLGLPLGLECGRLIPTH